MRSDGLDRDVGAGADREAEVGLRERGRVVDAVADHRDDAALGLQPADDVGLVGRQHLGDHLVDADLGGDRARGRLVVAGQQHRAAGRAPCSDATASADVGLTVSATTSTRAHLAVPGGERPRCGPARSAARARGVERGGERAGSSRPSARAGRPARRGRRRRPRRRGPRGWRSPRRRGSAPSSLARRARRSPGRSGARRRPRARRRGAAPRRASSPSASATSTRLIAAGGDRAGLVEHDRVDRARGLEDLRALDQQAELRAAAGADEQRGRRGEPERARAGDDQHGDGGGERERRRPRRRRARSRASRRRGR